MAPQQVAAVSPGRSARRRIAWITPEYPPDRGGVSDHSSAMANALRAAGHEVLVCPRPHQSGYAAVDRTLRDFCPDLIVVAFVPLGYAPRTGGVAPAFTGWCASLRNKYSAEFLLLAHEASLPLDHSWRTRQWKLWTLALAQVIQFRLLVRSFEHVVFSNEGTRRLWARRMPRAAERFRTVRVCSNIAFNTTTDAARELAAAGYAVPASTVLFFGTGHQSILFDYVEEAFDSIWSVDPSARLVIVGMTPAKLAELSPSLAARGELVQALGYVAAPAVSLWLQIATVVLAPLVEGVSARKGTVMAALQHGQTVITTRGEHTLDDIDWADICVLSGFSASEFSARALAAFRDPALRLRLGAAARNEYELNASVPVTAARILELAAEAPSSSDE